MRGLTIHFLIFSWVLSIMAAAQHAGVDLWGCASCSTVKDYAISAPLAYGGPFILGGLIFAVARSWRLANTAVAVAALVGLALASFMVMRGTICQICMLTHTGLLAAGFSRIKGIWPTVATSIIFAGLAGFAATGGWDRIQDEYLRYALYEPRDYDPKGSERIVVIFTDPECVRCKMLGRDLAKRSHPGVRFAVRWMLLPHTSYRTIRAAATIEDLSAQSLALGEKFRLATYETMKPLTDDVLLEIARELQCEDKVRNILREPSPRTLRTISSDMDHAYELQIDQLPAVAFVDNADVTGYQTMRLKPISELDRLMK